MYCHANGVGKCDPTGCPKGSVYNNKTMICGACQNRIGYYRILHCKLCAINGAGKCDSDGCPVEHTFNQLTTGLTYNKDLQKCELCQKKIKANNHYVYPKIECKSCTISGGGKCDVNRCPEEWSNPYTREVTTAKSVVYNNSTAMCDVCQLTIGGYYGLNCLSCVVNGAGRCDELACPALTYYNDTTHMCLEQIPPLCELN